MREITKIMKGWEFTGPDGTTTTVDLPHTWNARDGQDGGNDYWRGTCIYRTRFAAPQFNTASHQVWIQFDGVNASAHVVLNGSPVCNHDGGYSTFRANITWRCWTPRHATTYSTARLRSIPRSATTHR